VATETQHPWESLLNRKKSERCVNGENGEICEVDYRRRVRLRELKGEGEEGLSAFDRKGEEILKRERVGVDCRPQATA